MQGIKCITEDELDRGDASSLHVSTHCRLANVYTHKYVLGEKACLGSQSLVTSWPEWCLNVSKSEKLAKYENIKFGRIKWMKNKNVYITCSF